MSSAFAPGGNQHPIRFGVALPPAACAAFPALSAIADGYQTHVAVDASGTFNRTKHETGLLPPQQAGVIAPMVEILEDNGDPAAGDVYGALDMPFATLIPQLSSQAADAAA
jgi:hypothetical protein